MPEIADGMVNMDDVSGNASNLALYDFAGGKKLVEAVFTVNGTGTTNVDLNVVDLTLASPILQQAQLMLIQNMKQ